MTGSGMIVVAISFILSHFGIQLGDDQVTAFVNGAVQVVGVIMAVYGQLRRKDLHMGLIRKSY